MLKSAVLRGDLPSWLVIPSVTINNRETRFLRRNCLKSRWVGSRECHPKSEMRICFHTTRAVVDLRLKIRIFNRVNLSNYLIVVVSML